MWLLQYITNWMTALAQTQVGTKAKIVGTVNLADPAIVYDPVTGTLNGLTMLIHGDLGNVTVTFPTGSSAPTGPADVVSAINAAATGIATSLQDAAGYLELFSFTMGSLSLIQVTGGTALTALGFVVNQQGIGQTTGADGTSLIGGGTITTSNMMVPAGTLRSQLAYIANFTYTAGLLELAGYVGASFSIIANETIQALAQFIADKMARLDQGQTFTGNQTVNGNLAVNGTFAPSVLNNTGYYSGLTQSISTGTTAVQIGDGAIPGTQLAISPRFEANGWGTGTPGTLTFTLVDHVGSDFPQIEFWFNPTSSESKMLIVRATGSTNLIYLNGLSELVGQGIVKVFWDGTQWQQSHVENGAVHHCFAQISCGASGVIVTKGIGIIASYQTIGSGKYVKIQLPSVFANSNYTVTHGNYIATSGVTVPYVIWGGSDSVPQPTATVFYLAAFYANLSGITQVAIGTDAFVLQVAVDYTP